MAASPHNDALHEAVRGICREEMRRMQEKIDATVMQSQQRSTDMERSLGQRISEFEGALVVIQQQFNTDRFENAVARTQEHLVNAEKAWKQRTSELERALIELQEHAERMEGIVDMKASSQQLGNALNDIWEQVTKMQKEVSEKVYQHELESSVNRFQEELVSFQGSVGKKMAQMELGLSGLAPRIDGLAQQHRSSKLHERMSVLQGIGGDPEHGQPLKLTDTETMASLREQLADVRQTSANSSSQRHLPLEDDAGGNRALVAAQPARLGFKAHLSGRGLRGSRAAGDEEDA